MLDDPLPKLTKIARQTANDAWRPSLDDDPSVDAWTPDEARALLELGASDFRNVYGVCLFQATTGCRIGEALAMRWSAVDRDRGLSELIQKVSRPRGSTEPIGELLPVTLLIAPFDGTSQVILSWP
jgi:integrase